MAALFALVFLARLPFVLRVLFALALLLLPFELRLLFALGGRLLPFELRLLFALAVLLLPFELRLLLALGFGLAVAVERVLLLALVVRRPRPLEALEARAPFAREVWPLLAPARLVRVPVGFDLRGLPEVWGVPLLLPSFEVKVSTGLLRLVTSLPILLAAICATVATPAPAAKPLASDTRTFDTWSDACSRVEPTRLIASPTAVAAMARAVSLSSILRAAP